MSNHHQPILTLWALPRSLSTAFTRMMIERGDFNVFNSSFSVYYYFSTERLSDRYAVAPNGPHDYKAILNNLKKAPHDKPIFLKDMAYYVKQCMSEGFLQNFTNTFLIRHPKYVLPSLYKMMPDFTLEETGYAQQYRMFEMVCQCHAKPPVVIDGSMLKQKPEEHVRAYCAALDIPFIPDALQWKPNIKHPQLELWGDWYEAVNNSKGLFPSAEKVDHDQILSIPTVQKAYEHCLPFYEKMSKHVIL